MPKMYLHNAPDVTAISIDGVEVERAKDGSFDVPDAQAALAAAELGLSSDAPEAAPKKAGR